MFFNTTLDVDRFWPLLLILMYLIIFMFISNKKKRSLRFNLYKKRNKESKIFEYLYVLNNILIILVCILLVLAGMGFSRVQGKEIVNENEHYILFAIDISPSMSAEDIDSTSRWNAVKDSLHNFLDEVENKKIGIIIFSSSMSMVVPFTLDYTHIKFILENIVVGSLGIDTALSDAIIFTHNIYQSIPIQNKKMIIITDGIQNSGNTQLVEVEKYLSNISHDTTILHLGGTERALFNYYDKDTNQIITGILNPTDKNLLKNFAKNTKAMYYQIRHKHKLDLFFSTLFNIPSETLSLSFIEKREYFDNFILEIAVGLFLLFLILRHIILKVIW